jgi:16S rRNA (cytidine1402-2'-O)-methyltransferase
MRPAVPPSRRFVLLGQFHTAPSLAPGLHLVATPIGHLKDMSVRALETLAAADLVLCEDTRVTGRLTHHFGLEVKLAPYHEHNAARMRPLVLEALGTGAAVALVSDAGTPLVSDPGFKLVQAAQAAGHAVSAVPGASAVMAALSVAGLPTDTFLFGGFLPVKSVARRARLDALRAVPGTLVLFETGPRLAASLADAHERLGDRPAAICRELTKLHEEVRRDGLAALAAHYAQAEAPKGEIALVIGPPPEEAPDATDLDTLLEAALARLSVKDAAAEVAAATGLKRGDVYRRALDLSGR